MGIWGDLVKRTRPVPEASPQPVIEVAPPWQAPRLTLLDEETVEPLPVSDNSQATVFLTSALSRPLVLTPLPEDYGGESPKLAPPRKLPAADNFDPLAELNASLPALLARLRGATYEEKSSYTPEQAITFLSELSPKISSQARYKKVEEELSHISPDHQALAAELVGEAAARLVDLRRDLATGQTAHNNRQTVDRGHIEALEAELTRQRTQFEENEQLFQKQRQETLVRLDEMTGVIVFFDAYQAHYLHERPAERESDELPAFLQEDTAAKLLGIQKRKA